ncbi:MAG TPA: imelysin family protein [Edaphocola sp.]|nr:imelysin family protein [Edaphocola sp.]
MKITKLVWILAITAISGSLLLNACVKDKKTEEIPFHELEQSVLNDFTDVVANPLYAKFEILAGELKTAIHNLANDPTQSNLDKARQAWKDVRVYWEQSEGFLIGPVDYLNYDPYLDTWPTDYQAMEALLNSNIPITVDFLTGLDDPDNETELTLRGFHPLEYMLWGLGGNRDVNSYTVREKEYMTALADDIYNNVNALKNSWLPGTINFSEIIKNPSQTNDHFNSKREALEALANTLIDICEEVGDEKMVAPYDPEPDSTLSESPYSHNSLADFKNNIIGARNVYLCSFDNKKGKSLSDLVKVNNRALDNEIKAKFEIAINSFGGFTTTFEDAVYNQRNQVQTTLDALASLQSTIGDKLIPYIQQYVKD